MEKKLILIGGGGHARSCIDVIEKEGIYHIEGILDRRENLGKLILNHKIIGTDDDIQSFAEKGYWFLITIGQIKQSVSRERIFQLLLSCNASIATVISPLAYISPYSEIGKGTIVMHGAKVNAAASVGENCIINTNALIEHDTVIGDHNHISTNAVLNGNCRTGKGVFIGSGSLVIHGIEVCAGTVLGAGSVIYKNILQQGTYAGNPFKRLA
ncbi:acetyltransferase [Chitinophaga ginsengisegetis]|uniref:acetyltransferase n=1 Tax=Chitinophaga ginsengisegetis TaxID=393003 RepID=UPI00343D7951